MGGGKRKKSKNKKTKNKRRGTENSMATLCINEWLCIESDSESEEDERVIMMKEHLPKNLRCPNSKNKKPLVFEMHSHSKCSDGFLSPSALVDRAHKNGVKVLALTDHDTMAGVPVAVEAAQKYGIRVIPGVEISAMFQAKDSTKKAEPVHILAYYSSCGPKNFSEVEDILSNIREGRYLRAKTMLQKLSALKMPLKWEHVARIAGDGVAPGRVHVARALVEAKYVDSLKQAFSKYLYDEGPAYATGNEISAEEAVKMIHRTGGVSVLAHPWALKNPVLVIRTLKEAGLNGLEVYRGDGKVVGYGELADAYELLRLGGSDFHGRGGPDETDIGRVNIPESALHEFLNVAKPIWRDAVKDILFQFAEETQSMGMDVFGKYNLKGDMILKSTSLGDKEGMVALHLSHWLTKEEKETVETEAVRLKLSCTTVNDGGKNVFVISG